MNRGKPRLPLLRHPARHSRAPIAALCDVAAVSEARHQRGPGVRDARKAPSHFGRLVRKTKPGQGGDNNVKGFIGLAAMGGRVCQRSNDLQELDDRARPSMRQNDRQGILVLRSDVNEVDAETVNLRAKLRQRIQ